MVQPTIDHHLAKAEQGHCQSKLCVNLGRKQARLNPQQRQSPGQQAELAERNPKGLDTCGQRGPRTICSNSDIICRDTRGTIRQSERYRL